MSSSTIVRVFTLNCWGIPLVSHDRKRRMRAIGTWLGEGHCDVACLQEVWSKRDYEMLVRLCVTQLPHSHYFHSGVVGSGMCMLSRYPIVEVFFHQWPVNGYAHRVLHGDWWGGKGVALCRVQHRPPPHEPLNVYTVHMHAEYDRDGDEYTAHRVLQAYDTAQLVRLTGRGCGGGGYVLAGDLNAEPEDLACRLLLVAARLVDSEAGRCCDATHDAPDNSYASRPDSRSSKRIDYVLCGGGARTVRCERPLSSHVPGVAHSYSDHEALLATVAVDGGGSATAGAVEDEQETVVLSEAVRVLEAAGASLGARRALYSCAGLVLLAALCLVEGVPWPLDLLPVPPSTWKVARLAFTALMLFVLVMAAVWYKIEINAFRASSLSMRVQRNTYSAVPRI